MKYTLGHGQLCPHALLIAHTDKPADVPATVYAELLCSDERAERIVRAMAQHDALVAAVRIELAALIEQRDTGTTMLSRDARVKRMQDALQ